MTPKEIGVIGEKIAIDYLKKKNYKILQTNYSKIWANSFGKGEIDIIAQPKGSFFDFLFRKKETIHFIEVKTSFSDKDLFFSPEQRVNYKKQNQLIRLSQIWLSENKIPLDSKWQIDIISVLINPYSKNNPKIQHFENIVEI